MRLFQFKIILLTTCSLVGLMGYPADVLAKPDHSNNFVKQASQKIQIRFLAVQKDPPRRGKTPPASEGTGSRGDCFYKQSKPPLTRLVGSSQLHLTIDERPHIWIFSPYSREEAPEAEFSLQHGDEEVYQTRFQLPTKSGVFRIALPSTAPLLEINRDYRWYIDINCPSAGKLNDSLTPASLTGVVKRVKPSSAMVRDLQTAKTPLERISIYAKYGIWLNTLTELAQQRINEPRNVRFKQIWVDLLSQPEVGLAKISQEPIVEDDSF